MSARNANGWAPPRFSLQNCRETRRNARPYSRTLPYTTPNFIKKRDSLAVPARPDEPFIDVNETAELGMSSFSIVRASEKDNSLQKFRLIVRRGDRYPTTCYMHNNFDLTNLRITLPSSRSLQGQVLCGYVEGEEPAMRDELLGRGLVSKLITRLKIDQAQGRGIHARFFTGEQIAAHGNLDALVNRIDESLSTPLLGLRDVARGWPGLGGYRYETLGQLLVLMFNLRRRRNSTTSGSPFRQLLNFLLQWADATEEMRNLYLAALYSWAYLGTCNSCFDITLNGGKEVPYAYSMTSLSMGNGRPLTVVNTPELLYKIEEHNSPRDFIPTGMKVFEHGWLKLANSRSSMDFRYVFNSSGSDSITLKVPTHWAMSFLRLQEAVHRGAKSSLHGRGVEGLVAAIREMKVQRDNFLPLREMLADVVLLSEQFSPLRRICKNLFGAICAGVVAKPLIPTQGECGDFYGALLSTMNKVEIPFYNEIYEYFNVPGQSVEELVDRLQDERIRHSWIVYINTPDIDITQLEL